ncbi:hypothetical protein INT47_001864 [Mucor saturninus]|uniref:Uncharacterized protein n=1 Tax=Mucor saturninus TaxID=64648 RepID=A0A8H7RFK0_9FUNG|nr:hypothetical protein INT47_001864 [Mucor saturninus]
MNIFYEDGRGKNFDESGKEVVVKDQLPKDIVMSEATTKKERTTMYNTYSDEDRKRSFFFIQQRLMTPSAAAVAANVNYKTAREWVT